MPVHENSIEALRSMSEEIKSKARREVFLAIKTLGITSDIEIKEYLGWDINKITGRRNELVKEGKICFVGKERRKGQVRCLWAVSKNETQLQIKLPF